MLKSLFSHSIIIAPLYFFTALSMFFVPIPCSLRFAFVVLSVLFLPIFMFSATGFDMFSIKLLFLKAAKFCYWIVPFILFDLIGFVVGLGIAFVAFFCSSGYLCGIQPVPVLHYEKRCKRISCISRYCFSEG